MDRHDRFLEIIEYLNDNHMQRTSHYYQTPDGVIQVWWNGGWEHRWIDLESWPPDDLYKDHRRAPMTSEDPEIPGVEPPIFCPNCKQPVESKTYHVEGEPEDPSQWWYNCPEIPEEHEMKQLEALKSVEGIPCLPPDWKPKEEPREGR